MKIKITSYNETYHTFKTEHDDLDLPKLHEIWEKCLYSLGFGEETVEGFMITKKIYENEEETITITVDWEIS